MVWVERSAIQWEMLLLWAQLRRPLEPARFCEVISRASDLHGAMLSSSVHGRWPTPLDLLLGWRP
jgi:hypothetical protein